MCGGPCWWAVKCLGSCVVRPAAFAGVSSRRLSVCLSLRSDLALWLRLSTCVAVLIYLCFAYICKCYAVACAGYAAMVSQCCPLVLLK